VDCSDGERCFYFSHPTSDIDEVILSITSSYNALFLRDIILLSTTGNTNFININPFAEDNKWMKK